MSDLLMPHPDELIDHDEEWFNYRMRERERGRSPRWPEDSGYDYLNDPDGRTTERNSLVESIWP